MRTAPIAIEMSGDPATDLVNMARMVDALLAGIDASTDRLLGMGVPASKLEAIRRDGTAAGTDLRRLARHIATADGSPS